MANNSTQLTKQEAARYLWEEATDLPEGQICDIEFCTSTRAGNTLTVGDAWKQISTNQARSRNSYADTFCLSKAVVDDAKAGQHAFPVDNDQNVRRAHNMNALLDRDDRISQGRAVETTTLPPYSAQSGSPN
jgi:hypothetical protein